APLPASGWLHVVSWSFLLTRVLLSHFIHAQFTSVREICGKAMRKASVISSSATNRPMPLYTVARERELSTVRKTNIFTPIGGEIFASSLTFTIRIPNQIGAKPKLTMMGNTIGMVMSTIEMGSRNIPNGM